LGLGEYSTTVLTPMLPSLSRQLLNQLISVSRLLIQSLVCMAITPMPR
jgi:hypothetical protein